MLLRAAASHGRSLAFAAAAGSLVAWQSRSDRVECKKLLTPLQAADVSNLVLEQYQVPLVPHSIQLVLVQRVVDLLASEIEKNTDAEDSKLAAWFQQALDEGLTDDLVGKICDALAPALTNEDIPLLSAQQQHDLLETVVRALLSPDSRPVGMIAVRQASKSIDCVLNEEGRSHLIAELNSKVDIPFLDEAQEAAVIGALLDAVSSTLQRLVPRDCLALLRGASPVEIGSFQVLLTEQIVSAMPPVPGLSKEDERDAVKAVVGVLFDAFVAGSVADEAVASLSTEGRVKFLRDREIGLLADMELAHRSHRRRVASLDRQLANTKKELRTLAPLDPRNWGWNWAGSGWTGVFVLGGAATVSLVVALKQR